ncbi:MAG TPA: phasin family protein [Candidatus Sulfotelmatobacter sp.]|nr:phasin family protein [Candidatus Sulfotelmatobacter sp.]
MATQTDGNGSSLFLTALPDKWLERCQELSAASQAMAERWVENRAEQVQTNLDAWTKLASCKNPGEVAEVQQRWWRSSIDHLTAEMKGYQDQMLALGQQSQAALRGEKPASRRTG